MGYNLQKEKQEAIYAGEAALLSLKEAKYKLENASTWGIFDMLGGGFFSTMLKRANMKDSKACMQRACNDLEKFSKELNDVSIHFDLNIEMNDFLSFADYFFDGFLVDWLVQDRIHKSIDKIDQAIHMIEKLMKELEKY